MLKIRAVVDTHVRPKVNDHHLFTGIDPAAAAEDGYGEILDKLNQYLSELLHDKYHFEDTSDVALKFRYTFPDGMTLDVDLLLSPFWKDREELLRFLQTIQSPVKRLM